VPELGQHRTVEGISLIPIGDLVRMELTCFRAKDLKDLDEVGLITPEIESTLSPVLLDRLAQMRAR